MSFGKRLVELRKKRGLSQEQVATMIGTKAPAIGRYEREVAKPTIEVATKLAKVLEVSLDYLVGYSDVELDKGIISRIVAIQNLNEEDKGHLFAMMDAFLLKSNIKQQMG